MRVSDVERTVIDGWIRVMRFPVDAGSRLIPNGDAGPRNGLVLAIDRADATIRDTLGRLLKDRQLQEDARRRRAALDERSRALSLRIEAEELEVEADHNLELRQGDRDQLRDQAARIAAEREQQVERQRQERKQRARGTAQKQQTAVEHAYEAKEQAADKKAKRERLRVLDEQANALDTATDALTASDEAQRLTREAAKAKAARKTSTRTRK
jgi:hypothetical protein